MNSEQLSKSVKASFVMPKQRFFYGISRKILQHCALWLIDWPEDYSQNKLQRAVRWEMMPCHVLWGSRKISDLGRMYFFRRKMAALFTCWWNLMGKKSRLDPNLASQFYTPCITRISTGLCSFTWWDWKQLGIVPNAEASSY
jgi:hypothetical protein